MKQLKLIFGIVSMVGAISTPIVFSCASIPFSPKKTLADWNAWPISITGDKSNYLSSDDGFDYFASPSWNDYNSGTESQYDAILRPYNTTTGMNCVFDGTEVLDTTTSVTDGTTLRLNCLDEPGRAEKRGTQRWNDFTTAQYCFWSITDVATNKPLVIGTNADCTIDIDDVYLDSYMMYYTTRTHYDDTHAINSIKIKLNRSGITDSSALGYNKTGYWFNRKLVFNYIYNWSTTWDYVINNFPAQETASRDLNISYKFAVRQNVIQSEIVGENNASNWHIDNNGLAQYPGSTSQTDKRYFDYYTQELLIPTRVSAIQDGFVGTSTWLPQLKKISELPRSSTYTIGFDAFLYKQTLEVLSIPNCTSIGYFAFGYCNIRDVFASSLTQINRQAFYDNEGLQTFIGPSVTTLSEQVFYDCVNLTRVEFPQLMSFPTTEPVFEHTNLQQIKIGAPSGTPLSYYSLLDKTPIVDSNVGISNFNILIPAANAETDSTKAGWAKSYYNPTFGWANKQTASGHTLSYFFSTY